MNDKKLEAVKMMYGKIASEYMEINLADSINRIYGWRLESKSGKMMNINDFTDESIINFYSSLEKAKAIFALYA